MTSRVTRYWEKAARTNPLGHILGLPTAGLDVDEFFETGEADAERISEDVGPFLPSRRTAIEIGCGVGRVAIPMASRFDRIIGIDAAPTMLRLLREHGRRLRVPSIEPMSPSEAESLQGPIDLVFSFLTFQHVEEANVIRRYLRLTERWIGSEGVAWLQIDSRPRSIAYRIRNGLPDRMLRPTWRRGMRRIRRPARLFDGWIRESGLVVERTFGEESAEHVFIVRSAGQSSVTSRGFRS